MTFTWAELIDRARTYVDDDHEEQQGWISPERWLQLAQVEYERLYRNWVRMGVFTPAHTVTTFTGPTTSLERVLAIVGVGEYLGVGVGRRWLEPGEQPDDDATGHALEWYATGSADTLAVTVYPSSEQTFEVRYIQYNARTTDSTDTVDLPFGGDERLVLGLARRALIKESAASRRIDQEILDADAELNMTAWGRRDREAPKMRIVKKGTRLFPAEPGRWIYFG
jgi:hypothetical protein